MPIVSDWADHELRQPAIGGAAARLNLGSDSVLDEHTTGDVTLTGEVVFRFVELPPVRLESLRLVRDPDPVRGSGGSFVGGYRDWYLHPEDTEKILYELTKHDRSLPSFESSSTASAGSPIEIGAILMGVGVGFASGAICSVAWRRFAQSRPARR